MKLSRGPPVWLPEPGTPEDRPGWDQGGKGLHTPPTPLPSRLEPLPQPQRQAELRGAWNRFQGQPPSVLAFELSALYVKSQNEF